MELLSPAGNVEKLYYAYTYGADASYIGLKKFSLRIKADNFYDDEYKKVVELKKKFPGKRLHCALNISFHNADIDLFLKNIDYFKLYPIDAFIVQDLGMVPILQKYFPNTELHVSTQASCINREAVKMYKSLGFKRVVLGREVSLREIREIKDAVPDMELEAFAHGAMCIAYAGRCLMSAYLTARSAQSGACSHSCRWNYDVMEKASTLGGNTSLVGSSGTLGRSASLGSSAALDAQQSDTYPEAARRLAQSGNLVLQEHSRPGEYFPVFEGDDFTAVLSSKDLRMIEHLKDMKDAGVDSIKIEGRMKSIYYVALVTRAYRKALDVLDGKISSEEAAPFISELENVSHRESTTGFYYNRSDADKTTTGATDSQWELAATIGKEIQGDEKSAIFELGEKTVRLRNDELDAMHPAAREARLKDYEKNPDRAPDALKEKDGWHLYEYEPLNMVNYDSELEFVSPEESAKVVEKGEWLLCNPESGTLLPWVCSDHKCLLYTSYDLEKGTLLRVKDKGFIPNQIRDTGR
jgi:putative protease